jgi:tartrate-resistant acid phosphatase type 5
LCFTLHGYPRCWLQLDAALARRDPRWHCERSYSLSLAGGDVEIFFLDTSPLIGEYAAAPWRSNRGGLSEQSPEGQLRELEARLARSAATWKLVVGHHPIRRGWGAGWGALLQQQAGPWGRDGRRRACSHGGEHPLVGRALLC